MLPQAVRTPPPAPAEHAVTGEIRAGYPMCDRRYRRDYPAHPPHRALPGCQLLSISPRIVSVGLLVFALFIGNVPTVGAIEFAAAGEIAVVATTRGETLKLRAGPGT